MSAKPNKPDVVPEIESMLRYALALTRDAEAAQELVQASLVKAYAKRHTFDPARNLRTWLFSIVHNTYVSEHRRRSAEDRRRHQAADLAPAFTAADQEHAADLAMTQAAMARLPASYRETLHLVAVEGLSYQEAALALGTPVGTVMSRLSRARAALRQMLSGEAAGPRLRIVGGRDDAG